MIGNKKALVRMLEAIIAIIILLGFFIFVMSKQREKPNIAEDIYNLERKILTEVSDNTTLRGAVLSENKDAVEFFISERLSAHPALNFNISICNPPGKGCVLSERPEADIYVDDIVIGSLLGVEQQPKVLRLFVWIGAPRKVEVPAAECGNNKCEAGENQENCCTDCGCPTGDECKDNICTLIPPECTPGWKCHDIFYGYQNESCAWSQEVCNVTCGATCIAGQTKVCWTYTGSITYCKANAQQDGPIGACVFNSTSHPKILCKKGTKACITSTCAWGSCGGEVWPIEESGWGLEQCTNGIDDNCNGDIDECGF